MRRRLLLLIAGAIATLGAATAAYVVHREGQIGDVRGSSSVEYVPAPPTTTAAGKTQTTVTAPPKPPSPYAGIQWPMYGYDAARTRAVDLPLRPPYKRLWYYPTHRLVEFPPAIGYGRLYFASGDGTLVRAQREDRPQGVALRLAPLRRRLAGGRRLRLASSWRS